MIDFLFDKAGTAGFDLSKCTIGHILRPEIRSGVTTREVSLYEDDPVAKTRRVLTVKTHSKTSGKPAEVQHELKLFTIYDRVKDGPEWTSSGERVAYVQVSAQTALDTYSRAKAWIEANLVQFNDGQHWYLS